MVTPVGAVATAAVMTACVRRQTGDASGGRTPHSPREVRQAYAGMTAGAASLVAATPSVSLVDLVRGEQPFAEAAQGLWRSKNEATAAGTFGTNTAVEEARYVSDDDRKKVELKIGRRRLRHQFEKPSVVGHRTTASAKLENAAWRAIQRACFTAVKLVYTTRLAEALKADFTPRRGPKATWGMVYQYVPLLQRVPTTLYFELMHPSCTFIPYFDRLSTPFDCLPDEVRILCIDTVDALIESRLTPLQPVEKIPQNPDTVLPTEWGKDEQFVFPPFVGFDYVKTEAEYGHGLHGGVEPIIEKKCALVPPLSSASNPPVTDVPAVVTSEDAELGAELKPLAPIPVAGEVKEAADDYIETKTVTGFLQCSRCARFVKCTNAKGVCFECLRQLGHVRMPGKAAQHAKLVHDAVVKDAQRAAGEADGMREAKAAAGRGELQQPGKSAAEAAAMAGVPLEGPVPPVPRVASALRVQRDVALNPAVYYSTIDRGVTESVRLVLLAMLIGACVMWFNACLDGAALSAFTALAFAEHLHAKRTFWCIASSLAVVLIYVQYRRVIDTWATVQQYFMHAFYEASGLMTKAWNWYYGIKPLPQPPDHTWWWLAAQVVMAVLSFPTQLRIELWMLSALLCHLVMLEILPTWWIVNIALLLLTLLTIQPLHMKIHWEFGPVLPYDMADGRPGTCAGTPMQYADPQMRDATRIFQLCWWKCTLPWVAWKNTYRLSAALIAQTRCANEWTPSTNILDISRYAERVRSTNSDAQGDDLGFMRVATSLYILDTRYAAYCEQTEAGILNVPPPPLFHLAALPQGGSQHIQH